MYKTRSKFFQSFGFPHRLKKKKFKFTPPDSPGKNIKSESENEKEPDVLLIVK